MFRTMRRGKQAIPYEECIQLLKTEPRGVLSVLGDEGYPYGTPINQYYCEEDGKLYFHSGSVGHRIDAMRENPKASFCLYDGGVRDEGDWALRFRSVVVFGHIEFVEDHDKALEISRRLSRKFTGDEAYIEHEIRNAGARVLVYALVPEHITGKRIHEA